MRSAVAKKRAQQPGVRETTPQRTLDQPVLVWAVEGPPNDQGQRDYSAPRHVGSAKLAQLLELEGLLPEPVLVERRARSALATRLQTAEQQQWA